MKAVPFQEGNQPKRVREQRDQVQIGAARREEIDANARGTEAKKGLWEKRSLKKKIEKN